MSNLTFTYILTNLNFIRRSIKDCNKTMHVTSSGNKIPFSAYMKINVSTSSLGFKIIKKFINMCKDC